MSFMIKNDDMLEKYNEIWDQVKRTLNINVHSIAVYDEKCIKARLREFNGVIKNISLSFLVSPCYLQNVMSCQWSSSDLPRVLRI